jgi:hypothetical protein
VRCAGVTDCRRRSCTGGGVRWPKAARLWRSSAMPRAFRLASASYAGSPWVPRSVYYGWLRRESLEGRPGAPCRVYEALPEERAAICEFALRYPKIG